MAEVEEVRVAPGGTEALEVIEAAREAKWERPTFSGQLFLGKILTSLILPYTVQSPEDAQVGDFFCATLEAFLKANMDPDAIDRTGEIPPQVIQGLARLGCFGMKIPKEYGGLGLSQINYNRAIALIASHCGSTAVWLSAHQSIGVPQPLKLFGTEEQKKKYLPRLAKGAISAFALTEVDVGSDPAKMKTTATPIEGGNFYLLTGQKLWCTNGPVADILVVMAQTPPKLEDGREKKQITAFIVERDMPGFELVHRCQFMGLKGIQNGLIRFNQVRVPKDNILLGLGQGLKLALVTLNTGRLTLPAACTGVSKCCLSISRKWANERVQWGAPIGQHEAIAAKLSFMASHIFAMESVTWLTSALADRGGVDIRLEAAMAKLFCSEVSWRIVDETVQIRGGRGYETADSLRARGEPGIPVERIMRDARINLVIEGTSEIMRLFISREAIDPHMHIVMDLLEPHLAFPGRFHAARRVFLHYLRWYPRQWFSLGRWHLFRTMHPKLANHFRFVERTSHRLAWTLFHRMVLYQQGLERRQQLLFRLVDIGMDLFAVAASCSRAQMLLNEDTTSQGPLELVDLFSRRARRRIGQAFRDLSDNDDKLIYRTGRKVLSGKYEWLEDGILNENP